MHLADAFIQSDLQLHSGYTFSLVSYKLLVVINNIYNKRCVSSDILRCSI